MLLKLEIIGLILGILASAVFSSIIIYKKSIPNELFELFRGGEVGALIASILIVLGLISSLSFIISLFCKRFKLWWLRLLLIVIFFIGLAILGSSGI